MLIGIVGLIGSGKDTVAQRLVAQHGFKRDSFAKSLNIDVISADAGDMKFCEVSCVKLASRSTLPRNTIP